MSPSSAALPTWRALGRRVRALVPSIFDKVVIANALIIAVGVVIGARLNWMPQEGAVVQTTAFLVAAVSVSIGVNYLVMRLAFAPIVQLLRVMRRVEAGDWAARAPDVPDTEAQVLGRMLNRMLDRLEQHRTSIASAILEAQEDERKRIARELHDETSQSLTSLLIQFDMLEAALARGEPAHERIASMRQQALGTLEEVRRLTYDLRPTMLDDLGLIPALRWYVRNKLEPAGLAVSFEVGDLPPLRTETTTALFRIAQEAMTNIIRHARADTARIRLFRLGDEVVLEIRDDGRGFDPDLPGAQDIRERGLGLHGMRERAALLGGRVTIESAPGRGTCVQARLKIDPPARIGEEEDGG